MSHRSRCHRAFATTPLLAATLLACLTVIALRANQTWDDVAPGMSESQVIAALGEPVERSTLQTVTFLRYDGKEIWLREGEVFTMVFTGDHDAMYRETCVRMGLPLGTWGESTDWRYGDVHARLFKDRLVIMQY